MNEDKFVQSYENFDLMFDPEPHQYSVMLDDGETLEIPAVSDITDYLAKYLAPWAQKIGVEGMQELLRRSVVAGNRPEGEVLPVDFSRVSIDDADFNIGRIKDLGLDHKAIRDKAATRGTYVHAAYRTAVEHGIDPKPENYHGETIGYVKSVQKLTDVLKGRIETICCEQPVASLNFGYAGTPDHVFRVTEPFEICTGGVVRRKYETLRPGDVVLLDLKTSKQVYMSHAYQLAAYEIALKELGLVEPGRELRRFIALIKPDGDGYNCKHQKDAINGFLHTLGIYNHEKRQEGWLGRTTFCGLAAA